ncbi:MAG: hypothetical protein H6709_11530 [Kofleriaceae bacterium]|nr:hypothetical protein [Myxococcales bacterium]MCB9562917.1 hypothetical protein [Kofleriaceae bacterium]MCB9572706.1 hypothetical protein [Kofleriaceae bacterium]
MEREDDDRDAALDAAIARYRADVAERAALAATDLDELEDHLRALVDDLRAAGRTCDAAFDEAVRRLGEPRALAREYRRRRPEFSAPAPRATTWSAATLVAGLIAVAVHHAFRNAPVVGLFDVAWPAMGAVLFVALVTRLSWARPLLFGFAAFSAHQTVLRLIFPPPVSLPLEIHLYEVGFVGLVLFLAPWRRDTFTAPGWALALCASAFAVVMSDLETARSWTDGPLSVAPATAGAILLLAGLAGVATRARWAAVPLLGTAAMQVTAILEVRAAYYAPIGYTLLRAALPVYALLGAAVIAWRTGRTRVDLGALVR